MCNGLTGEQGPPGPAGTSCSVVRDEAGGSTIITCEDGTTAVVRDGAPGLQGEQGQPGSTGETGLQTLVRLEAELGGPRCAFGGTRILVGTDQNRNGVLEGNGAGNGEVADEGVVCGTTNSGCAPGFIASVLNRECVPERRNMSVRLLVNGTELAVATFPNVALPTALAPGFVGTAVAVVNASMTFDNLRIRSALGDT